MAKKTVSGQSLVEFAVIIPSLLLLIMGTLDFGRVFYIIIALQSAAREGAFYLSYHPTDAGVSYQYTYQAVQLEANNMGVQVNNADIIITCCSTPPPGCVPGLPVQGLPVQVIVKQTVNLFFFNFITGSLHLSSQVSMMVQ